MGLRGLLSALRRKRSGEKKLRCSFCGSRQNDVRNFISGPDVHICSRCVEVCVAVLEEDAEENPQKEGVIRTESMAFNENQVRGALRAFTDLVDVVQERFPEEVVEIRFEHQGHVLRLVAELRSGDPFACHYDLESDRAQPQPLRSRTNR